MRPRRFVTAAVVAALLLSSGVEPATAASQKKKRSSRRTPVPTDFDAKLPVLGTQLAPFPEGEGKAIADQACLQCHSASMVLQQHLNEKQWTASVDKMVRWGAPLGNERKAALIAYLVDHFGPENESFTPTVTRPVGR
jgi:cytochrome c5